MVSLILKELSISLMLSDFISKISKLNKNYITYSDLQRKKYMDEILNFKKIILVKKNN